MGWPDFFVLCLVIGFVFSLLSVLSGAIHLPHLHLHMHWHGGALAKGAVGKGGASPINAGTIAAFLMWFGAAGYLLTRFSPWTLLIVLFLASFCGLVGAAIVFWFLARVLIASEHPLDPVDYDMTGVLGRLSTTVRKNGTGEMIFTQEGRRCGVPVRSETGEPLDRGTEVIVTRYEGGIAYVRTWEELQKL
jgi:membrane protein implicated in regulation of membrane protease activity